jgi:hypothetical protein
LTLAKDLQKRIASLETAPFSGWRDSGAGPSSLAQLQNLYNHVKRSITALETIQKAEALEETVANHAVFQAFTATILQARVFVGREQTAKPTEGEREDLFPFYASLDVGAAALGFASDRWDFGQYFGVNFYFVPVDPSEPLHHGDDGPGRFVGRRFSVTLGITTNGGQSEADHGVSGIVGSQFLLSGAGFRVLEFLRLSGGLFYFRKDDLNPLVDDPSLSVGGYGALSLDLAAFTLIASGYRSLTTGDKD